MTLQGVSTNIRDKKEMVIYGVYKGLNIREIAAELQKSIGTVQQVMAILKQEGLITNEPRRSASLTEKGEQFIRNRGLSK